MNYISYTFDHLPFPFFFSGWGGSYAPPMLIISIWIYVSFANLKDGILIEDPYP